MSLELDLLTGLIDSAAGQGAEDEPEWKACRAWLHDTDLDGVDLEHHLEDAAQRVRALLLRRGHALDERHFRSPDSQEARFLPSGGSFDHSYERSLPVAGLESRLGAGDPPPGWEHTCVVFRSCMAALGHLFGTLTHMLRPTERRPLTVGFWGDYFETDLLLEYQSSSVFSWRRIAPGDVAGTLSCEVLLLEPVRYNWSLDALDVGAWVRAWRESPVRPRIVVVDTTLVSPVWPTERVLRALGGDVLVVEVRSGLKLDQQGLELANLGIVDVYSRGGRGVPTAEQLGVVLRLARSTTGAGPSVADAAALDVPFVGDPAWQLRHAGAVLANNARVAAEIADVQGVFAEVVHPSLLGVGHCPFVIVRLAEDTLVGHGLVLAAVRREAARRGIRFTHGSSFGFRSHRFETIVPRVAEGRGLFKVAAGAREGPFLDGVVEVLREIGGLPDLAALQAKYPNLEPVPLT
ncbi:hypothetical protein AB0A74_32030 [Saccharothrix sp. NPDC042600]|uniref:hypothetical protein n=1 Tax=Saccharothrix TaxID=2071 RepID=UPI0033C897B4